MKKPPTTSDPDGMNPNDPPPPWSGDSAFSRRLQSHWQAQTPPLDTHAAWQRLQAQLPPARPRLRERLAHWRELWLPTMTFAAGAACALLVLALLPSRFLSPQTGDAGTFVALSGPPPAPAPHADHALLQVGFTETARITEINRLLLQLDASLVAGPSALGLYTLAIAPDKLAAVQQQLQASPLVDSVAQVPTP
jgi:hypothetical protein